jgi:hypothetical protein
MLRRWVAIAEDVPMVTRATVGDGRQRGLCEGLSDRGPLDHWTTVPAPRAREFQFQRPAPCVSAALTHSCAFVRTLTTDSSGLLQ